MDIKERLKELRWRMTDTIDDIDLSYDTLIRLIDVVNEQQTIIEQLQKEIENKADIPAVYGSRR